MDRAYTAAEMMKSAYSSRRACTEQLPCIERPSTSSNECTTHVLPLLGVIRRKALSSNVCGEYSERRYHILLHPGSAEGFYCTIAIRSLANQKYVGTSRRCSIHSRIVFRRPIRSKFSAEERGPTLLRQSWDQPIRLFHADICWFPTHTDRMVSRGPSVRAPASQLGFELAGKRLHHASALDYRGLSYSTGPWESSLLSYIGAGFLHIQQLREIAQLKIMNGTVKRDNLKKPLYGDAKTFLNIVSVAFSESRR
jgi:hypothetical protein